MKFESTCVEWKEFRVVVHHVNVFHVNRRNENKKKIMEFPPQNSKRAYTK